MAAGGQAGSACTPDSRFIHRRVKTSPGDNVSKKMGDKRPTPVLEFRSSRFKGLRFPKAEPWSPPAGGENPHNGAFFLQSFFFAPSVPKKKRQSPFAGIISVNETAFSEPPLSQNLLNVDTNRDGMEFCTVGTGVLDGPFSSPSTRSIILI